MHARNRACDSISRPLFLLQASGPDAARQLQNVHDAQVDLSRRLDRCVRSKREPGNKSQKTSPLRSSPALTLPRRPIPRSLSSAFEERWSTSASERLERAEAAAESLSAVRGECRALVSEALARVADQFDALGASLEASLESRAREDRVERESALRERQGALREEVGGQLEALRTELRRQLASLSEAVGARLAEALAAPARELELAERKLAESVRAASQTLHARVDGAVADVGAAERAFQMGAAEHERRLAALEQGAALQAGDVRAQAEALLGDLVRANVRALASERGGRESDQGAER